jgi:hypothetical protein
LQSPSNTNATLYTAISDLIEDIFRHPENYKLLPDEQYRVESHRALNVLTKFEYNEGIQEQHWSQRIVKDVSTGCKDDEGYVNRIRKSNQIVETCVQLLDQSDIHGLNRGSFLLGRFFKKIWQEGAKASLNIDHLRTWGRGLCDHALRKPYVIHTKLWLENIWMKDKIIDLSNGIVFRYPELTDFDSEGAVHTTAVASTIALISRQRRDNTEDTSYRIQFMYALKLFRLGAVEDAKYQVYSDSPLAGQHGSTGHQVPQTIKYGIGVDDAPALKSFLDIIIPYMPPFNWTASVKKLKQDETSLYLAIERYAQALTKLSTDEERIAATMSAFEAILIEGADNNELSHKLSQKIATIAGLFGANAKEMFKTVKSAYRIRSYYVHGSMQKFADQARMREVFFSVINALRHAILAFIALRDVMNKEKFINAIDNALIDATDRRALEELITNAPLLKLI